MSYSGLKIKRYVTTFFCKFFAELAVKTHFKWTLKCLSFFINSRGKALGHESVICMNKTKKWQKRAEKCIAAFHEFEMYKKQVMKNEKENK